MFASEMLTQTLTYWATPTSSPVLVKGRWSVSRKHLYTTGATENFPQGSVVTFVPLALDGLIALGDASAAVSLSQVSTLHWVQHSKQTVDFSGANGLYRSDVKPVWVLFDQEVAVFETLKVPTSRSFTLSTSGNAAYQGPASVELSSPASRQKYEGQFTQTWDAVVTVPLESATEALRRGEVAWGGRLIEFEGSGLRKPGGNPLLISWAGTMREAA